MRTGRGGAGRCGITRRSCASRELRNIQPSAGADRRVNEALARSRSSASDGHDGGRGSRPVPCVQSADDLPGIAQQRNPRSGPFGGFEHTGQWVGGKRTDRQTSTWMPPRTERIRRSRSSLRLRAHTAGGVGLGERTPQQSPTGSRASRAGSGPQFFLSNLAAATSNWATDRFPAIRRVYPCRLFSFATRGSCLHGQDQRTSSCAPDRRSMRAATASVQPVSVASSTSSTGPPAP